MKYAAITETGKRKQNEDSCFVMPTKVGWVAAVSDGMGGHSAGETASRISVDTLRDWLSIPDSDAESALLRAFQQANDEVCKLSRSDPAMYGMGATLVAVVATENSFVAANVGDSRLYLKHRDELRQVTHDHSFVEELVRRNIITKEEARLHPRRNIITRSIGTDDELQVDLFGMDWEAGDQLLLCSDGLCGVLDDAALLLHLNSSDDPETVCTHLIQAALALGSTDNITAVLLVHDGGLA